MSDAQVSNAPIGAKKYEYIVDYDCDSSDVVKTIKTYAKEGWRVHSFVPVVCNGICTLYLLLEREVHDSITL